MKPSGHAAVHLKALPHLKWCPARSANASKPIGAFDVAAVLNHLREPILRRGRGESGDVAIGGKGLWLKRPEGHWGIKNGMSFFFSSSNHSEALLCPRKRIVKEDLGDTESYVLKSIAGIQRARTWCLDDLQRRVAACGKTTLKGSRATKRELNA